MEPKVHREKPYEEASRGSGVSESHCRAGGHFQREGRLRNQAISGMTIRFASIIPL